MSSEYEKGIVIGGLAVRIGAWLWPLLRQILIAAVSAWAAAVGKEMLARYVDHHFKQRKNKG